MNLTLAILRCALTGVLVLATHAVQAGTACTPIVLDRAYALVGSGSGFAIYAATPQGSDLGLGGPLRDDLNVEFYDNGSGFPAGTVNLAAGGNANYATCSACILLKQDVAGSGTPTKYFFQRAGSLSIGASPPLGDPGAHFTATGVELEEVTINPDSFVSQPVPGGDCYVQVADRIFANGFDAVP